MDLFPLYDHFIILKRPCKKIGQLIADLQFGLGERLVDIDSISLPPSDISAIALRLNESMLKGFFVKGPQSKTPIGIEYVKFWGKKAQLRHIDGDLCECLSWSKDSDVTEQIVDYILDKHNLSRNCYYQISTANLQSVLLRKEAYSFNPFILQASTRFMVEAGEKIMGLFEDYNKGLPLDLKRVHCLSASLRTTSPTSPLLVKPFVWQKKSIKNSQDEVLPLHSIKPHYVVVDVESTTRWPDSLHEFRLMKRLFLIRLRELLSNEGISSRITLTNMLDIYVYGLILRLSLNLSHEYSLLQRHPNSKQMTNSVIQPKDDLIHLSVSEAVKTETVHSHAWSLMHNHLLQTSSLLQSIARSYPNAMPAACALAKRWLASQGFPCYELPDPELEMLACGALDSEEQTNLGWRRLVAPERMCDVAVELLIVYAACLVTPLTARDQNTYTNVPIISPAIILYRFLYLLVHHDWDKRPLLINLNHGFTEPNSGSSLVSSLLKKYHSTPRDMLPAMVLITPLDHSGSMWTDQFGPTRQGLKHLQSIAKKSYQALRAMLVGGAMEEELRAVFEPVDLDPDVLITVNEKMILSSVLESIQPIASKSLIRHNKASHLYWQSQRVSPKIVKANEEAERNKRQLAGGALTEAEKELLEQQKDSSINMGSAYWPLEYEASPMDKLMHFLYARFNSVANLRWNPHGSRWIGMYWKPEVVNEDIVFKSTNMDGLVTVVDNGLGLRVCKKSLVQQIKIWGMGIFHSIEMREDEATNAAGETTPFIDVDLRKTPEIPVEKQAAGQTEQSGSSSDEASSGQKEDTSAIKRKRESFDKHELNDMFGIDSDSRQPKRPKPICS